MICANYTDIMIKKLEMRFMSNFTSFHGQYIKIIKMTITHWTFANDLFILFKTDITSAATIQS